MSSGFTPSPVGGTMGACSPEPAAATLKPVQETWLIYYVHAGTMAIRSRQRRRHCAQVR
jgi:hypothetical protein